MTMKPKTDQNTTQNRDLFRPLLCDIINPDHELTRLTDLIDWSQFDSWSDLFPSKTGRPATSPRLIAGLFYLQHLYGHSDEGVLEAYLQSPYYQHFCGRVYFEHELPIDPSSLVRWRKRLGVKEIEKLLHASIRAALNAKMVTTKSFKEVIVDTTVMEKAITYPTDSKLIETARQKLVKQANAEGIQLRQNYNRVGPRLAIKTARYAHARQFKRMRASLKKQSSRLGRIIRDIERKATELSPQMLTLIALAKRVKDQQPKDKHKCYSLHAPEVKCIAKGKARQPYEFGTKVSVSTTLKEGLVVGMKNLPHNPYDGHSLVEAIEQTQQLTEQTVENVFVDKGYKGHKITDTKVYIAGQKRGMTASLKKKLKRRSAIEPTIGHMKTEGRLNRCGLKGEQGDSVFALLCGAGQNLRLLLKFLRELFMAWIFGWQMRRSASTY